MPSIDCNPWKHSRKRKCELEIRPYVQSGIACQCSRCYAEEFLDSFVRVLFF